MVACNENASLKNICSLSKVCDFFLLCPLIEVHCGKLGVEVISVFLKAATRKVASCVGLIDETEYNDQRDWGWERHFLVLRCKCFSSSFMSYRHAHICAVLQSFPMTILGFHWFGDRISLFWGNLTNGHNTCAKGLWCSVKNRQVKSLQT